MFSKQPAITRSEHIGGGGRRAERIAKAINNPAFQVHAGKQRCCNTLLALAQEAPDLFSILNIAGEKDNPRRLQPFE
jgi:hypothetical protein